MTLGGLALAVGILVDDATVTIENINSHLEEGAEVEAAILEGAQQIALPALVSTLSICIVFVPMFMLAGIAKYLFVPLAEAVVFAMLASYLLSRTLIPTLSKYWLKKHVGKGKGGGQSSQSKEKSHGDELSESTVSEVLDEKSAAEAQARAREEAARERAAEQARRANSSSHGVGGKVVGVIRKPLDWMKGFQQGFEQRFEQVRDRYHTLLEAALRGGMRFALIFLGVMVLSAILAFPLGRYLPGWDRTSFRLSTRGRSSSTSVGGRDCGSRRPPRFAMPSRHRSAR